MKFRLKALGLHLSASTCALSLILGALYLGWYYWPGWALTDVTHVVVVMVGVDVVVGPLLTFVIARASKPRRELVRDIAMIVAVQLCALIYGTVSLWHGRPLYYAYSETVLQLVQAYDIDAQESAAGRRLNPDFAPHWYSLPRWIWAPLPQDPSAEPENRRLGDPGRRRRDLDAAILQTLGTGLAGASNAPQESRRCRLLLRLRRKSSSKSACGRRGWPPIR